MLYPRFSTFKIILILSLSYIILIFLKPDSITLSFSISILFAIQFFCLYKDLTVRKISNKIFRELLILSVILNSIEFIVLPKFYFFFIFKSLYLLLSFLISFFMFSFKIIGGSDGKLFILIFITHPVIYLTLSHLTSFFLFFLMLYVIFFIFNFVFNLIFKDKYSFDLLFNFYLDASLHEKLCIRSSYNFINISELEKYREDMYEIKSSILFYNNKRARFQFLIQYRPPLILLCLLTYYIVLI